eukprot:708693-Pyramimonas_sp.AAC.1
MGSIITTVKAEEKVPLVVAVVTETKHYPRAIRLDGESHMRAPPRLERPRRWWRRWPSRT